MHILFLRLKRDPLECGAKNEGYMENNGLSNPCKFRYRGQVINEQ